MSLDQRSTHFEVEVAANKSCGILECCCAPKPRVQPLSQRHRRASTASEEVPEADRFPPHRLQYVVIPHLYLRPLYGFMSCDLPFPFIVTDSQVDTELLEGISCSRVQRIIWVKAENEPVIMRHLNSKS
jgi:hypothetical protein